MSNRLENNQIAARYAKALFESLTTAKEQKAVLKDLESVSDLFESLPQLFDFFQNPGIPSSEKENLLKEQFEKHLNPWVYRLLLLLLENGRMVVFPQLFTQFLHLRNQQENIVPAEVITASELDKELKSQIGKAIEKMLGVTKVELQSRVDPGLLGGVVIKVQDQVIDGSYIGRLESLRKQIATV